MGRRRRDPLEDRIDDVVRGRERVTLEVLVELIDSVNPTGRGLTASEQRDRYRLKGRLQSVLIREHAELVVVERVDEVIVSLRLDGTGRHAAHARIDALDDDARSLVQRRLDLPEDDEQPVRARPTAPAAGARDPIGDLELGDAAMQAYDYEAAREHYERAARTRPTVEAELRLLSLLVDVLVDDASAIERGRRAPAAVLEDHAVSALLAVAEARSGSTARARERLEGNVDPSAAAAWVELGRRGLRDCDRRSAADAALRARALDPMVSGLDELEGALARGAAESMARLERELAALVQGGADDETILERSRAILAEHPSSRVAAAEKRRVEEQRADRLAAIEIARVRQAAATASTVDELAAALASLRRAAALGVAQEEIDVAQRRLAKARVASEAGALRGALSGSPRESALLAWLAASREAREQTTTTEVEEVAWLDELGAPASGAAAKGAVRAVLDLARAIRLVADGKLSEAEALLEASPQLARVARARALRETIEKALQARSLEQLEQVSTALQRGDIARADELWAGIDEDRARAADPAATARVHGELTQRARLSRLRAEMNEAFASLDLPRARGVGLELVQAAPDEQQRRQAEAEVAAQERACAERHGLVVLDAELAALDGRDIDPCAEISCAAIDDVGKRAVIASFYDEHAFLRVVPLREDGSASEVVRCIACWSVVGTLSRASVQAKESFIEISARSGHRVRLSWEGRLLEMLPPPRAALSPGILLISHIPEANTVWAVGMEVEEDPSTMFVRAIDARTGRIRRTVKGVAEYGAFTTPRGLELWGMSSRTFTRLDADAVPFGMQHTLPSGRLLCLRPSIDDAGPYVLTAERELDASSPPMLRRYDADGSLRDSLRLDGVSGAIWSDIAPTEGGCFVRSVGERSMTRLVAVRERGGRLEVAWELDPPGVAILIDSNHCGVWAARLDAPIEMARLSLDAPPRFGHGALEPRVEVAASSSSYIRRLTPPPFVIELAAGVRAGADDVDDAALAASVEKVIAYSALEQVWATAFALGARAPELSQRLFARAMELAPDNDELALEYAQHCLLVQRFDDALRALQRVAARGRASTTSRALLVAARYGNGACDDALRESRALLAGMSPKDPERAACESFHSFLDDAHGEGADVTLAGRRVRALLEAVRLRDARDLRGAIALVDVPWMWRPRETTALGMLAELWAAVAPTNAHDAARRLVVLAANAAHDPSGLIPLVLPGRPYAPPPDQRMRWTV